MRILIYQPYNQTVLYIESIVDQFVKEGHQVFFVSHAESGATHQNMEKFGCITSSLTVERKSLLQYYIQRIAKLARFCINNRIEIVYSHYQEANIISVFSQYFCKAKFIINRHHTDCAFVDNNLKEKWGDRIINLMAKVYIATSPKVYQQIVEIERVNPKKVRLINYGYNFENFPKINSQNVVAIRGKYATTLLLVVAARFIPEKRHEELIDSIRQLVDLNFDLKLLILGRGPLEKRIESQIVAQKLEAHVFNLGFQLNIMDYFAASDMVVHFSISEASNSAIKEAAYTGRAVAVCTGVGDFDEYIVSGTNGILLDRDKPGRDFVNQISGILANKDDLASMGDQLRIDVMNRFDIKNVISEYQELNRG